MAFYQQTLKIKTLIKYPENNSKEWLFKNPMRQEYTDRKAGKS